MMAARGEFDEACRSADRPVELIFEWVPRLYNVFADHLCNVILDDEPVHFAACTLPSTPLPRSFGPPSEEDIALISKRIVRGELSNTWRSIAPALRVAWHVVVSMIASWDSPWALVIAPAVLLQRNGSPYTKLTRCAASPNLLYSYFFNAAHELDEQVPEARTNAGAQKNYAMVEKLAMHSPAKALKMLTTERRGSDDSAAASIAKRFVDDDEFDAPTEDILKPNWINRESIIKLAATRLARAAAPGPDGWTRELFLASWTRSSAVAFELILNNVATGTVPRSIGDVLRASRLATWAKPNGTDYRVVGMTSTLMKIVWKALSLQHLAAHRIAHPIATFSKGGALSIIRWARARFEEGADIMMCDVVDAYWRVHRPTIFDQLRKSGSPLARMFLFAYGSPATCALGSVIFRSRAGIIPGCGGGSILFALDTQRCMTEIPRATRLDLAVYADDITATSKAGFDAAIAALAPKTVSKIRVLSHSPDAHPSAVPAMRVLGGYLGDESVALQLFSEDIDARLATLNAVTLAPISCQAKWFMIRSIECGLRWKFAATQPSITSHLAEKIDDAIAAAIFSLANGLPTHKSRTLLYTPTASGGLGVTPFATEGASLYDCASALSTWPPEQQTDEDQRAVTPQALAARIAQRLTDNAIKTLGNFEIQSRSSPSTPWFNIPAVQRELRIPDDSYRLFLANYLLCDTEYSVCGSAEHACEDVLSTYDHSQTCIMCAGPYRIQRHNAVMNAFRIVASRYGVQTSENFKGNLGVTKGIRPDVLVFRLHERPLAIDFCVFHQAQHQTSKNITKFSWTKKVNKYKDWMSDTVDFTPLTISTNGSIPNESYKVLEKIAELAVRKGFARDCAAKMKLALVNYELYRHNSLSARGITGFNLRSLLQENATDEATETETDSDDDGAN